MEANYEYAMQTLYYVHKLLGEKKQSKANEGEKVTKIS